MNIQNNIQTPNNSKELVRITNLTKKYKNKAALSNINLTLEPGHIIGLLGPNGSGKTTLMKLKMISVQILLHQDLKTRRCLIGVLNWI